MVEVVGEGVEDDDGEDFNGVAVGEAGGAEGGEVVVVGPSAFGDDGAGEDEGGAGAGVGGVAFEVAGELFGGDAGVLAEEGVG